MLTQFEKAIIVATFTATSGGVNLCTPTAVINACEMVGLAPGDWIITMHALEDQGILGRGFDTMYLTSTGKALAGILLAGLA